MAGRVLKSLENEGVLRASGKTVVLVGFRPAKLIQPAATTAERMARTVAA
jgi:hypothetical protein